VVPYSKVNGVTRISNLPTSLKLAVAFDSIYDGNIVKYHAKGNYISLENFNSVQEKCLIGSCMNEVFVSGYSDGKTAYLTFTNHFGESIDQIKIDEIAIYGLRNLDGTFSEFIHHSFVSFQSTEEKFTIQLEY
jgi:hypothetical protein